MHYYGVRGQIRVRKEVVVPARGECWTWTGAIDDEGYGRIWIRGQNRRTHRVMYEIWIGVIPPELTIDHLCRNRACVNPEHLEAVPQKINMARGIHATKTHCKHGHEFTAANTRIYKTGRRCRACNRIRSRASRVRSLGCQIDAASK